MGKRREKYQCPVCGIVVKRLTPHLRRQHLKVMGSRGKCELYANYAHLKGKRTYRGRAYKVCPVKDCFAIVADVPLHLRSKHSMHRVASLNLSKQARKIEDVSFEVPPPGSPAHSGVPGDSTTSSDDGQDGPMRRLSVRMQSASPPRRRADTDSTSTSSSSTPRGRDSRRASPVFTRKRILPVATDSPPRKRQKSASVDRSCREYLEAWTPYLSSTLGGSVDEARAREIVKIVERYVRHYGCLNSVNIFLERITPKHVSDYFETAGGDKSPYWCKNVLLYVGKFLRFLEGHKVIRKGTHLFFTDQTKGISKTISLRINKHRVNAQTRKRCKLLNVDIKDLHDHPMVVQAIKSMKRHVADSNRHMQRFLMARMLLNSGARTGVLAGMLVEEVYSAEHVVGRDCVIYYVVNVKSHKTGYQGPVSVPCTEDEYNALLNLCNYLETTVPSATHCFVTKDGIPFTSSRISHEWATVWGECGLDDKYGRFSITDNRKHYITFVLKKFPHLRESVSKQMKHSVAVERSMYDLSTAAELSVSLRQTRRDLTFSPQRKARPAATATVARCPSKTSEEAPVDDLIQAPHLPPGTAGSVSPVETPFLEPLSHSTPVQHLPPGRAASVSPLEIRRKPAHKRRGGSVGAIPCSPPGRNLACPPSPPGLAGDDSITVSLNSISFKSLPDTAARAAPLTPQPPVLSPVASPEFFDRSRPVPVLSPQDPNSKVIDWLQNTCEEATSTSIFSKEETRSYSSGKKTRVRRTWTTEAEQKFSVDFLYDIDLAASLNKKPSKRAIVQKLDTFPEIAERWRSLSIDNIKDKIWVLAVRQQKMN